MSRLAAAFERLKRSRCPGLITYTTAGDPDLDRSTAILLALARSGADVLEVGVPFSDPVADGPVIEQAAERARAAGGTLRSTLDVCARVRQQSDVPLVVFTYANPVVRMGLEAFADTAHAAGVDGVLVLDLPVEESVEARSILASRGLDQIFLLSPTSTDERIGQAGAAGSGFVYVISRLGVTGARDTLAADAVRLVDRVKGRTSLPVAVGFGVSRPEHVAEIGRFAEAAVVGSALVSMIHAAADAPDLLQRVEAYVGWLKGRNVGRTF